MTGENAASHHLAICIIFHLEREKAWEWTRMKLLMHLQISMSFSFSCGLERAARNFKRFYKWVMVFEDLARSVSRGEFKMRYGGKVE